MIENAYLRNTLFVPSDGKSQIDLSICDHIVPVKFLWNETCTNLLVSFHGAVDRKTRVIPCFSPIMPNLGGDVAQLSVSDPLMLLPGDYGMTWYSGSESFPAQTIFEDLFNKLIEIGGFERIVFCGSSGGGFAALYYSSLVAGSIAIAGVPQASMQRYYPGHIKRYVEACWPSLTDQEELSSQICTDLCRWYSVARPNTVIYLQSPGDHFHTRTQFAPFISEISRVPKARFIVNSDYWGRLGHSGSVPVSAIKPWIRAAFLSATIEVDDLLQTYYNLQQPSEAPFSVASNRDKSTVTPDEVKLANLLRDYHLRQPLES